jgi:hypothetical protein
MGTVTTHIDIDAPAAVVWSVLEDVRRLPEFSHSTVEVVGPPRLERVAQEFEQTVELAGKRFTSTWSVVAIDPGTCLQIRGSVLPGTSYTMTEKVSSSGPCTSTLSLTMDYKLPFGPLGRLASKLGAEGRALDEAEEVLDGVKSAAERACESEWTTDGPAGSGAANGPTDPGAPRGTRAPDGTGSPDGTVRPAHEGAPVTDDAATPVGTSQHGTDDHQDVDADRVLADRRRHFAHS